jgi:hypothetical protein
MPWCLSVGTIYRILSELEKLPITVTLTSCCLLNGESSQPEGCIFQPTWITTLGCFHEPSEHILEQCLDVLVKFLRNLFNDSVHSPSELHFVTFNIQQMDLAHVQFLILIDEEFFILCSAWYKRHFQSNALLSFFPLFLCSFSKLYLISSLFCILRWIPGSWVF